MRRHLFAFLAFVNMTACAHRPAVTSVAIPVPCIAQVPERPKPLPQPIPADARVGLDLALAKLAEWVGYGEKADAVMRGCVK